jgi:hypothetical protein
MRLNVVRNIEGVQTIHADQQHMFDTLIAAAIGVSNSG